MRQYYQLVASALAISALSLGTIAGDCRTNPPILTVYEPGDLGIFRDGCTSITGNLVIDSTFSGDFVLENVTEIIGNISNAEDAVPGALRVLDLPNLVKVGAISVHRVATVNLGSLEHAGDILLGPSTSDGEVNLGALQDANNVGFEGGWKSIDLSSLETVSNTLAFYFARDDHVFPDVAQIPLLHVDLPVLKSAGKLLTFEGQITSLSVPELEMAGDPATEEEYGLHGLRMNIEGIKGVDFEFPKLHTLASSTQVYGNISRIRLPALGETATRIEFNTAIPIEIYSTIETALDVWLWGEIKSVHFPNMVDLGGISFAKAIRPCNETLVKLWETIPISNPPEHETSWFERCFPEDIEDSNDDNNHDDEEESSSHDDEEDVSTSEDHSQGTDDDGPDSENDTTTTAAGEEEMAHDGDGTNSDNEDVDTSTASNEVSESSSETTTDTSEQPAPTNRGVRHLSPANGVLAWILGLLIVFIMSIVS
ncbi:uncharacterized protein BDV14DRAFT_180140 [Aspergillus stella-maris]|uniref:uncharacterized protein n=1 Tax=Aspergillus stella-maris TaxID=1810926 RepID=UPI003CCD620C